MKLFNLAFFLVAIALVASCAKSPTYPTEGASSDILRLASSKSIADTNVSSSTDAVTTSVTPTVVAPVASSNAATNVSTNTNLPTEGYESQFWGVWGKVDINTNSGTVYSNVTTFTVSQLNWVYSFKTYTNSTVSTSSEANYLYKSKVSTGLYLVQNVSVTTSVSNIFAISNFLNPDLNMKLGGRFSDKVDTNYLLGGTGAFPGSTIAYKRW